MAWRKASLPAGDFLIDPDAIRHVVRARFQAEALDRFSYIRTESQWALRNPFSWGMPDLVSVAVDWDKVPLFVKEGSENTIHQMVESMKLTNSGVLWAVNTLRQMQRETIFWKSRYSDKVKYASDASREEIRSSELYYSDKIDKWKLRRDLAGAFIVGVATIYMPGTLVGFGFGAVGSAIKITAKYQDTEGSEDVRRTVASIEAAQDIILIIIPCTNNNWEISNKAYKFIISTAAETGMGYAKGDKFMPALAKAAVINGSKALVKYADGPLKKVGVPVKVNSVRLGFKGAEFAVGKIASSLIVGGSSHIQEIKNEANRDYGEEPVVAFLDEAALRMAIMGIAQDGTVVSAPGWQ